MWGAIGADVLIDLAKSMGVYHQPELDGLETPPWFFVKPEYLTDVPNNIKWYTPKGAESGWMSSVDHPSFTRLREHLGSHEYIKIQRGWSNGDRVLKPFYLNNFLMLPGDRFPCACAMRHVMERHGNYNDGKIDPSVKNYREEGVYV